MSFLLGLSLTLIMLPINFLLLKTAKTKSVNVAYMFVGLSLLLNMFLIFLYVTLIMLFLYPQQPLLFALGLLGSVVINLIFKILYTLK